MKKLIGKILFLLILFTFITSCDEEKVESKNMEQIYKEEGIPVKVKEIDENSFSRDLSYNAVLSGIKESTVSAFIGGRIEKVNVKVGDFVKKDQVIFEFPEDSPSAQFYQAKVAYENSKTMYERYQKLFEVGGISAQNLDNVKTQYEVNKANWDNIQRLVKVLAPISGYVTQVAVKETDNVRKEALLAIIADLRKLKTSISVSEDEINDIKKGNIATAEWQGIKVKGKVTQVDMAMNPYTQSFNADIVFDNSARKMKAGVTADITIQSGSNKKIISVDRKNLIADGKEFFAFTLNNGIAKKVKLKVGKKSGVFVEVLEGLNIGDKIIIEGQMFLDDNTKVKIIK
ncbi:MAG: efflux transporter periplasmic adaptor subunit [Ignavibacteriae bacterium]|nr:MAG: efflux transporter periplasmic adaptor subunit [Ignavibacteriota bacterium]